MPHLSAKGEFLPQRVVPYFQPVMDLRTDRVCAYECLARLLGDNDNLVLPGEFLSLVAQHDGNAELTRQILTLSAEYFRRHAMPFSINLCEDDIQRGEVVEVLIEALTDYPNPGRLSLEVEANAACECRGELESLLHELRRIDLGLYVDHFGADPSHQSLLELPLKGVKFEGNLIRQLVIDNGRQAQIKKLLDKTHWLGMVAVAEHIEDALTLETVQELGFHYGQGFYFSLPQAEPGQH